MMKTITVKGVGNISAKPDYITISMTVESMDRDYEKAMDGADPRIERTSFNVETRYENVKDRQGNYKREFAGYACVYRLKLAFDFDSKQLAKVISAISGSEANPELSIAFTVKNPAKVSEELLISAAQNARAKAEILCKASGAELGQLISIDYNWGEVNIISRTSYEMEDCLMPLAAMGKCCTPEIEPDDIDVSDTVAFTWEIK